MSENNQNKSRLSAVIATAVVALAAVAAIIVLVVTSRAPKEEQTLPDGTVVDFRPTQELVDECGEHAQELVAKNYTILRLFVTEGLPHKDEPYGNRPEDGLYTANSSDYKTFDEIEKLVKSCFTEKEAKRILTQMPADPAVSMTASLIEVYKTRDDYVNGTKQKVLGINEQFKPFDAYNKPWSSISIRIVPSSDSECYVTVYLGAGKDVDLSSVETSDILTTQMVKENGEWRLSQLIY